jgi:hypothetical protein
MFGTLAIREYLVDHDIGKLPPVGAAFPLSLP